jgi:hypothetical protein
MKVSTVQLGGRLRKIFAHCGFFEQLGTLVASGKTLELIERQARLEVIIVREDQVNNVVLPGATRHLFRLLPYSVQILVRSDRSRFRNQKWA